MDIRRTACAGVELALDGKRFLMDGVCREVKPYPATPPAIRQALLENLPDALLLTHKHADHYDEAFVSQYHEKTEGPILGPSDIPFTRKTSVRIGDVTVLPIKSRHIGKTEPIEHMSFILQGSQCVWFLGDSSPLLWKNCPALPKPDVMIAPYAYGIGTGWDICKSLGAKAVIILHLPERSNDPYRLWQAVESTVGQGGPVYYLPKMGEQISI